MRKNNAILISYLCYIAIGFLDGMLGVIWPAMSADLGVPLDALGILLLVALVGFVLVSFNYGAVTQALSFHSFLLVCLLLRAIGFVVLALYPSWSIAIACFFIMSIGSGGVDTGLNVFISERGNARQLNWLHASFGIGATSGPFLAAGVLALGGTWNWNFGIVAGVLAVIAVLVWATAPLWQFAGPEKSNRTASGHATATQSLRLPVVWISTTLFFFYVGMELTAGQWSFTLFSLARGIPDIQAKFWVGIYWGIFTIGRILFGLVADRVSIDRFLRFALVAAAFGAFLLYWNPLSGAAMAGLVLMGLAEAPIYPSLIAGTAARVGKAHAANAIGFQVAAAGVGGTLITGLVGFLATGIGLEAIAGAILALSLINWLVYEGLLRVSRV
jgi:fucose permease